MISLRFMENGECKEFQCGKLGNRNNTGTNTDLVDHLQRCLEEISKPHPHDRLKLKLWQELITQPALTLLIQLLNQPFTSPSSSTITETSTMTGDDDEATKWNSVEFISCRLALPDSSLEDKALCCSPDDIQIFALTVALRTKELTLSLYDQRPDILHAMYDYAPQPEISIWNIEKPQLSAMDCARLSNILQRSARPPRILRLHSYHIEDPLVLVDALVNLQELSLSPCFLGRWPNSPPGRRSYPLLGDMLVGEGGTGMMPWLLQNPFSQLKHLWFRDLQLDDCHFMAMVDMLPTSQLEELSLSLDNISWLGIMAFAQQLPSITSLKTMLLPTKSKDNRLKDHHQECCMALTQGMRDNYSIETLYMEELDSPTYNEYPYSYYADLNHAGRRILVTSKPVPAGLWPWILERSGTKCFRRCRVLTWEKSPEIRRKKQEIKRINSIYFLLQNSQALLAVQ